jgi:phage-related protein
MASSAEGDVRGRRGPHAGSLMPPVQSRTEPATLMLRAALVAVVVAAAVLVAGCGKSSSTSSSSSPSDWANGLCSALATWSSSVKSAANSLKGGNVSESSLKSAAGDIKDASNTLVDDLKGLGKPNTTGGQQAKDAVDQLSSEVKTDVGKMQSAVDNASGLSGAVAAASTVSATLSTMATQINSTASKLDQADAKGELQKAFKDAPACSSLTS